MKKLLISFGKIWKSEGQEDLSTPKNASALFELRYKNMPVGVLTVKNGEWEFVYSDEFKRQHDIQVIVDFPDVNKTYTNESLWPFFSHRIPGLGQPNVKHIIEKEKLDPHSEVDLLKRFGRQTITNPFELNLVG